MCNWFDKFDPGPCPVDDAPHTTCTSPGYTGVLRSTDVDVEPFTVPTDPPRIHLRAGEFTTATYRRAIHGPKRKRAPK
jgi:hypothetical protein